MEQNNLALCCRNNIFCTIVYFKLVISWSYTIKPVIFIAPSKKNSMYLLLICSTIYVLHTSLIEWYSNTRTTSILNSNYL